jgi:adenylate kinase family enzyme
MSLRVAIIGNSGSGKSFLARRMADSLDVRAIELDGVFWLPGGFNTKRPAEEVDRMIAAVRSEQGWIVEGVFGDLVDRFLDLADRLIWLDLPWGLCKASLMGRGSQSSKYSEPAQAEGNFQKLLTWSSEYWTRADLRSHAGHERMFAAYPGPKHRFTTRDEVDAFMRPLQ